MKATLLRSLVAALLIGPAIGFLNEATSVQKAMIYNPPFSEAEMARMKNLSMNEVDATLRSRRVQLTRWEWLQGSIHYEYFWKRVAASSIVPSVGVFLACVWIGWTERLGKTGDIPEIQHS